MRLSMRSASPKSPSLKWLRNRYGDTGVDIGERSRSIATDHPKR